MNRVAMMGTVHLPRSNRTHPNEADRRAKARRLGVVRPTVRRRPTVIWLFTLTMSERRFASEEGAMLQRHHSTTRHCQHRLETSRHQGQGRASSIGMMATVAICSRAKRPNDSIHLTLVSRPGRTSSSTTSAAMVSGYLLLSLSYRKQQQIHLGAETSL